MIFNRKDSHITSGVISGAGSVSQQSTGTTIFTAAQIYTGRTTDLAGTHYQAYSRLGRPYLSNIFSSTIICFISIAIALMVILFLIFGQYTQRVSVAGVLLPSAGLLNILAPADGLLTLCEAKEGFQVSVGENICILNIENKKESQETTLAIEKWLGLSEQFRALR